MELEGVALRVLDRRGRPEAFLTRITVILACCFFLTSLGLSLLSKTEISIPPPESFEESIDPDLPEIPLLPGTDAP